LAAESFRPGEQTVPSSSEEQSSEESESDDSEDDQAVTNIATKAPEKFSKEAPEVPSPERWETTGRQAKASAVQLPIAAGVSSESDESEEETEDEEDTTKFTRKNPNGDVQVEDAEVIHTKDDRSRSATPVKMGSPSESETSGDSESDNDSESGQQLKRDVVMTSQPENSLSRSASQSRESDSGSEAGSASGSGSGSKSDVAEEDEESDVEMKDAEAETFPRLVGSPRYKSGSSQGSATILNSTLKDDSVRTTRSGAMIAQDTPTSAQPFKRGNKLLSSSQRPQSTPLAGFQSLSQLSMAGPGHDARELRSGLSTPNISSQVTRRTKTQEEDQGEAEESSSSNSSESDDDNPSAVPKDRKAGAKKKKIGMINWLRNSK
jgi:hypothetical protein